MAFNSLHFLIFFSVVALGYFSLPHRHRWVLLLGASYYFYMSWKAEYAVLLLFSTAVPWAAALAMDRTDSRGARRLLLGLGIAVGLGLLSAFKYLNFVSDSLRVIHAAWSISLDLPYLRVLLPVGISFYTFHTLSYIIDVYRGQLRPERHFGIFAAGVAFFPPLVAGPIERPRNLLPQFRTPHRPDERRIADGLWLMLWGFFLKIVIADRLAGYVDAVYNDAAGFSGLPLLAATYLYSYQIYCDFAGYSLIAIGAARVLGFSLMENFRRPYSAASAAEFWRRWHISLSSWLRDYLYIPLGGNRRGTGRRCLNLFVVFFICGLWHGAGWTFITWGVLHSLYLIGGVVTGPLRAKAAGRLGLSRLPRLHGALKVLITFHLATFAWIFFRANTMDDAVHVATHLFSWRTPLFSDFPPVFSNPADLGIALGAILVMEAVHFLQEKGMLREMLAGKPLWITWAASYGAVFAILLFGVFRKTPFIYFQF
jgi:D-alanyl-lipoteichoic acid acyltransferase DltB (MBOAT superfamily)